MLSPEEDVEAHALHKQGWTISAIARHLGRSRATVRAYLNDQRTPGKRRRSEQDPFDRFAEYVTERLKADPHVWASALYDEVRDLGYRRSYQRFTYQLREHRLRPHCEGCDGVTGRPTIDIPHPAGEEIQWDFLELPSPWNTNEQLHLLVGTLSHSGKMRATFCESEDQAHVIDGIDRVLRKLGGTARRWRFDRMAAVVRTGTGRVLPGFLAAAKYYGVGIDVCPPRRGNRKGVVESRNHFIAQRWWRTARVADVADAERSLDRFCARIADGLPRLDTIVRAVAAKEPLLPLPVRPFPAALTEPRRVDRHARVSYDGNWYAVSADLVGRHVTVRAQIGSDTVEILAGEIVVATHRRAPTGSHAVVRTPDQRRELEQAVLSSFSTAKPCKRKENRPPGPAALAIAAALRSGATSTADAVVVDLEQYAAVVEGTR